MLLEMECGDLQVIEIVVLATAVAIEVVEGIRVL
jgi:hypothetical protein